MQITEPDNVAPRDMAKDHREGQLDNRVLIKGEEGTPTNFKFNIGRAVQEWTTPRHRHDFDQIRYPIEGEFVYAKDKVLPAGHVAYFPAGVHYGPQIRRDGLFMVLCQFGGADGQGFISTEQREAVMDRMKADGTFKDGIYSWRDAGGQLHQQDAAEAVRERAKGAEIQYPAPRYDDIITMNPDNYAWLDVEGQKGVQAKWLGSFTERNAQVGFLKLEPGAAFQAGMHDAKELLLIAKGSASVGPGNRAYAKYTAFGFDAHEGPVPLVAAEPTELFCIHLPKF